MKKSIEVIDLSRHPELQRLAVDNEPYVAILRDPWGQELSATGGSTADEALNKLKEQQSLDEDIRIINR